MIVVAVCAFAACKKDSSNSNSSLIVGKWKDNSYYIHIYNFGYPSTITDTVPMNTQFTEFTSNGKCYDYDTTNYVINGNTLILTESTGVKDTATILILDANNLKLDFRWANITGWEDKISGYTR